MSKSEEVCKVTPQKDELLSFKRNVLCQEEGCSKSFIHDGALRMHLVKSHGLIKTESDRRLFHKRKSSKWDVSFQFHCPETNCIYNVAGHKHFSTYSLIKQHYIKVHAERRFTCVKCEQTFQLERDLRRHSDRCGVLYQCGSCPVKYTTTEALLTHCKRQEHSYPELYKRQTKKINKPTAPKETVVQITTHPVIFVTLNVSDASRLPVPLQGIRPKPADITNVSTATNIISPCVKSPQHPQQSQHHKISQDILQPQVVSPEICHQVTSSKVTECDESSRSNFQDIGLKGQVEGQSVLDQVQQSSNGSSDIILQSHRHNAMIQTDIYGVKDLAIVDENSSYDNSSFRHYTTNEGHIKVNVTHPLSNYASVENLACQQKVGTSVKRKLNMPLRKEPSVIPRKKKMKSTTGIQTSVTLTGKKRLQTVSGTQTTGDYILQTAMAHANIQVERRTVASQVTPQKPSQMKQLDRRQSKCSTETQTLSRNKGISDGNTSEVLAQRRPVCVDFVSQVRENLIWAETSHNLAERHTMTDLPLSASTQTLQSYLENLQGRQHSHGNDILDHGNIGSGNINTNGNHVHISLYPENVIGNQGNLSDYQDNVIYNQATTTIKQNDNVSLTNKNEAASQDKSAEDNVVKIFSENFDSSVEFTVPSTCSAIPKKKHGRKSKKELREEEYLTTNQHQTHNLPHASTAMLNDSSANFDNLKTATSYFETKPQVESAKANDAETTTVFSSTLSTIVPISKPLQVAHNRTPSSSSTLTSAFVSSTHSLEMTPWSGDALTTDTEAQTMTASEFNRLLESNGINLDNAVLTDASHDFVNTGSILESSVSPSASSLGSEFDFLTSVPTIDMNTQTASDFNLFSSYNSIDMNTQTGGEIDFLDLVMTSMETQTLNEDDMVSLGLMDSTRMSIDTNGTQSQGVGTEVDMVDAGMCTIGVGHVDMHSLGVGTYEWEVEQGLMGAEGLGDDGLYGNGGVGGIVPCRFNIGCADGNSDGRTGINIVSNNIGVDSGSVCGGNFDSSGFGIHGPNTVERGNDGSSKSNEKLASVNDCETNQVKENFANQKTAMHSLGIGTFEFETEVNVMNNSALNGESSLNGSENVVGPTLLL